MIALRRCTTEDNPVLHELVSSYHVEDRVPHDASLLDRILVPLLDGTAGRIWFIEADDAPVGYVALCYGYSIEFGGRDAFVDEIYVAPAHRGRGIGATALHLLDVEARTLGVRAIHLEVDHGNPAARLYERVGFSSRDRYRLMSKPLAP